MGFRSGGLKASSSTSVPMHAQKYWSNKRGAQAEVGFPRRKVVIMKTRRGPASGVHTKAPSINLMPVLKVPPDKSINALVKPGFRLPTGER